MFANSYFPTNYFPPGYFPKTGGEIISKVGHGSKVAGQLYIQAYLKWLQERRELRTLRPGRARVRVLSRSVIQAEQERIEDQKKGVELQLYSVLLAEI